MTSAKVGTEPAALRRAIAKLTGKRPRSHDAVYLARRLDELLAAQARGEDVRARESTDAAPMSVSLPRSMRDAVRKMARNEGTSTSTIVQRALAAYATALHPEVAAQYGTDEQR